MIFIQRVVGFGGQSIKSNHTLALSINCFFPVHLFLQLVALSYVDRYSVLTQIPLHTCCTLYSLF